MSGRTGKPSPSRCGPTACSAHRCIQPPLMRISAPAGGVGSSTRRSQPSGRRTGRGPSVWPRRQRTASGGSGRSGSMRFEDARPARPATTRCRGPGGRRRRWRNPACTRRRGGGRRTGRLLRPRPRPAARRGVRMTPATTPKAGGGDAGRPAKTAPRSANSHGRPRQPRPMTTPSQPVSAIMRTASAASQMSPLPSTGNRGHGRLQLGDGRPGGVAGVALLGGAGVEGDGGGAFRFGDQPGGDGGEEPVVDAPAELDRDRDAFGGGGLHRCSR